MGGAAAVLPVWAVTFGFFVFASGGLPGLSGFVGEFLVLVGSFAFSPAVAAVATLCMILAAAYLLWMYQRVAFGEVSDFFRGLGHHLTDMDPIETLTLAPLAALVVTFGIFPGLVLDLIEGSAATAVADANRGTAIAIAPQVAVLAIALPIVYVILRAIYAAYADSRDPLRTGSGAPGTSGAGGGGAR
jgi:NADH-quinone oxidoreductase subunit M